MNIVRHSPNLKYICRNLSLPGFMKAYFVTALHHEVFDGVFKWLLSEVGREEAGVSRGNSSSNTAIQRNSLFWTDVMFLLCTISSAIPNFGQIFPKHSNDWTSLPLAIQGAVGKVGYIKGVQITN